MARKEEGGRREDEEGRGRRTSARRRASDIKSNNPHLAGGEKWFKSNHGNGTSKNLTCDDSREFDHIVPSQYMAFCFSKIRRYSQTFAMFVFVFLCVMTCMFVLPSSTFWLRCSGYEAGRHLDVPAMQRAVDRLVARLETALISQVVVM